MTYHINGNPTASAVRGAIYGDIIGSVFEFNPIGSKEFELLSPKSDFTDDTIMTLAIAKAVMESGDDYADLSESAVWWMQKLGRKYPNRGYGLRFAQWLRSCNPKPYNSFGNGSAMRVSPVGAIAESVEQAAELSRKVTEVTHNHSEGIKGAEVTAVSVFFATNGGRKDKQKIQKYAEKQYGMLKDLHTIKLSYVWNEICQKTVPESIECFLESENYEDTIRNCVFLGGDSDTMGAIAGAIAGAYYGAEIKDAEPLNLLTSELRDIYEEWDDFSRRKLTERVFKTESQAD